MLDRCARRTLPLVDSCCLRVGDPLRDRDSRSGVAGTDITDALDGAAAAAAAAVAAPPEKDPGR